MPQVRIGTGHSATNRPDVLDPALLRPADVTLQIPNTSKFAAATGWAPRCSFEDSVAHLLDHWRAKSRREQAIDQLESG